MTEPDFNTEYAELLASFPHGHKIVEFQKKWHTHMGPDTMGQLLLVGILTELTKKKDE